jgi:hypothetical protein
MLDVCVYVGLVSTLYMTGIVWFAQLVHYPMIDRGDPATFQAFARDYQRRTLWVVTPALAGEIGSAILLLGLWPSVQSVVGTATLAAIWVPTAFWIIPAHLKLKRGYDRELHLRLVRSNLVRSFLWTLRAAAMIWAAVAVPAA